MNVRPYLASPTKAWVQTTQSCNRHCVHCYGDCGSNRAEDEMSLAEFKSLVDQLYEEGIISLSFEGGEPLHRGDIWELLEHCSRRFQLMLRTNGTLVDSAVAQGFRDMAVGPVVVDLQGATPATHDRHYGVAGSFELAVGGIRHLRAAGVAVIIACIVTRHNAGELQGVLDLAQELDVNKVGFLRLYPLGRARRNWDELAMSLDDQMQAVKTPTAPEGVLKLESWHPNDGNCCWENAGITAQGRSIGCPYLRDFVDYGNVREVRLLDTWDHPLYRQLRSQEVRDPCGGCHREDGTAGGCRSSAYAFTGDWSAPDPFCSETNEGIDLRVLPMWLQEGARPTGQASP
jgi:radical SAM protein with 4Fe4S-binding SPASM domain